MSEKFFLILQIFGLFLIVCGVINLIWPKDYGLNIHSRYLWLFFLFLIIIGIFLVWKFRRFIEKNE